jgi:hypothetical protein
MVPVVRERPFAVSHRRWHAAVRLHQTGQSCIAQHFLLLNVADADI